MQEIMKTLFPQLFFKLKDNLVKVLAMRSAKKVEGVFLVVRTYFFEELHTMKTRMVNKNRIFLNICIYFG